MGKIVNKRELAQILGISERSLTEWQREGLPMVLNSGRGASNQYDTADVINWRIARAVNGTQQESPKDRLDRLRGDREELELAQLRGTLVSVSEIEPALAQFIADAVDLLTTLPDKFAPIIVEAGSIDAVHGVLQDVFEEVRQQLGSYEFRTDPDYGDSAEADAAAAEY